MRGVKLFSTLFMAAVALWGLFSAANVPIASAQTGLLNNYSFDSGLTGWSCLTSSFGTGIIPNNCEALTDSGTTAAQSKGDSRIRQLVYLEPGVYTIEAQARAVTQGNGSSLCNVKSAVYLEASGHSSIALNFATQNYSYHVRESAPFTITTGVTAVVTFKGNNTAVCGNKSNIDYILLEGETEEEEPEPEVSTTLPPVAITATCVITELTVTMSDTVPITTTEITTLSANILNNHSFEQVNSTGVPVGWTVYPPSSQPDISATDDPYSGTRSIVAYDVQETNIYQSLDLPVTTPTTITWYYGAYVREGNQGIAIVGPHNGRILLQPSPSLYLQGGITNYVLLSGTLPYTNVVAGGVANYQIKIPQTLAINFGSAPWYIDEAFLIPSIMLDGQPVVHCPTVAGATPGEEENPVGGSSGTGGIPVPTGPAGTVCWECQFPEGRGVELAIAWLGCVLRNLFSCDLRIWFMNVVGAVLGVFAALVGQSAWLAGQGQAAVNWWGLALNNGIDFVLSMFVVISGQLGATVVVEDTGMNVWELIYGLFALIPQTIDSLTGLFTAVSGIISLILSFLLTLIYLVAAPVLAIINAILSLLPIVFALFNTNPLSATEFVIMSGGEIPSDFTTIDGAGYLSFFWGLAMVNETIISTGMVWVVYIMSGFMALMTIWWLIKQWQVITPAV